MKLILLTISLLFGISCYGQNNVDIDSLTACNTIKRIVRSTHKNVQNDSLTLISGKLFNPEFEHTYIRFATYSGTYIQIFSSRDDYNQPILNYQIGPLNYMGDTIQDINGDGSKDFAIHWYPSSGCCLAHGFDCFIYNKNLDSFNPKIEILNPTFVPNRAVTYSMTYNHPGETRFYKLRWVENKIDTINSYSWKDKNQSTLIISNFR